MIFGTGTPGTVPKKKYASLVAAFLIPVFVGLTLSGFRNAGDQKNITIVVDGTAINFSTSRNFVGEALTTANIDFSVDDLIMPPAMATLEDGDVITIRRVKKETVEEEVLLPFETMILDNPRLRVGSEIDLRAGSPGLEKTVIERELIDGAEVSSRVISTKTVMKPVSRKIYRGTRVSGNTVSSKRMEATAYTAGEESCAGSVDGLTCVLKKAGYGVAAVDPRLIALGTRLYIEGYGFAVASDIGGDIKGNRIDLFMSDVSVARSFGRRPVIVHLLD